MVITITITLSTWLYFYLRYTILVVQHCLFVLTKAKGMWQKLKKLHERANFSLWAVGEEIIAELSGLPHSYDTFIIALDVHSDEELIRKYVKGKYTDKYKWTKVFLVISSNNHCNNNIRVPFYSPSLDAGTGPFNLFFHKFLGSWTRPGKFLCFPPSAAKRSHTWWGRGSWASFMEPVEGHVTVRTCV